MKGGQRFRSRVGWRSCAAAGVRGTRPFAKNAKERGTHCVADATEFKGRATRRSTSAVVCGKASRNLTSEQECWLLRTSSVSFPQDPAQNQPSFDAKNHRANRDTTPNVPMDRCNQSGNAKRRGHKNPESSSHARSQP